MSFNEKLSYTEHVVESPTTDFAIGFTDYGSPSDSINVLVDNVPAAEAGYTVTRKNNMVVALQPAVNSGVVRLQRETNLDDSFYQFTAGAKFVAANIDANFNQILHSQQETRDGFVKLKDDIGFTNLEETIEAVHAIYTDTVAIKDTAEVAATAATAQASLAQDYANASESSNVLAQQAAVVAIAVEGRVYTALDTQQAEVDAALSNLSTEANKFYPTLAAANADIVNIQVNQPVTIGESANGGLWYKVAAGDTNLTKSPYDPLTQSKLYTDSLTTNILSTAFTESGYISATGVLLASSGYKSTGFIKVVPDQNYRVYSQIAGAARHAWYDKNQVFISAFGSDQTTLTEKTYIAPTNAAYMRVSAYQAAAWDVAYIKSKAYSIDVVQKIIQQHMPNIDASKIDYNGSNVKATLDTVINKQNTIIANQNGIVGQLDLMTDKESPYFVNTSQFVKAVLTPTNFGVVNVTARVSDTQMTVSDATAFIYSGSCVVYDPTANSYTSHNVIGINGTTITVMPPLPTNPTQAQTMHDSNQGQHLTLFGYKGLADFALNAVQKYSYKKPENRIFNFNPTLFSRQTSSQGQITTDGTTIAIPVTYVGTAKTGGFVSGTTSLLKACDMNSGNLNIGNNAHTQYLTRSYQLTDGIAGNGFEISFDGQGNNGFIEIPLAVRDESYTSSVDSQTYRTSGKARLQVFNGSTSIHDVVYAVGQVHHVFVDFTAAETIKVRVTCETSTPTSVLLSGIFAYKKSANTSKDALFKDGDVVAFLGDSWTQYPIASTIGETGQIRPDGSISTGSQWLSRRMKEKLLVQGKNVTMLNMGFGGQTSRWGKYWVNTIINLDPKPTHCVLCFYINDANSIAAPTNNLYDFDPNNMFLNVPESSGGVNGKIPSYDAWEANIKWLCEKLSENGIKPIVIMPSQTGSATQAQAIRSGELDRLADGFN